MKIAILQPRVPHYRTEFFNKIREKKEIEIYTYINEDKSKKLGFKIDNIGVNHVKNFFKKGLLAYSIKPFIKKDINCLVLMLHIGHVTSWILLLTKFLHKKKIILWGQGISVKRYLKEEKSLDWKMKLMAKLSDGLWLYTEKERQLWAKVLPNKPMIALGNTISGIDDILKYHISEDKSIVKSRYDIKEDIILLFCARFESNYRRTDLLEETIKRVDNKKYGFVIIGDGKNKPDFSKYNNVHDFGAIYDTNIKQELFSISDIYFQPGWVGLSIVEAMGYGLPIFTFRRSEETKQCVEYSYIKEHENGIIFDTIEDCTTTIETIDIKKIKEMGVKAKELVANNLTTEKMANNALILIDKISSTRNTIYA